MKNKDTTEDRYYCDGILKEFLDEDIEIKNLNEQGGKKNKMEQIDLFKKLCQKRYNNRIAISNYYSCIFIDEEEIPHIKGFCCLTKGEYPTVVEFKYINNGWVAIEN